MLRKRPIFAVFGNSKIDIFYSF